MLALMLGYIVYLIIKPGAGQQPMNLEAKAALDAGRFEAAWKDGEETALELRMRARADLGTQDLEAPGPLVKRERRENE